MVNILETQQKANNNKELLDEIEALKNQLV